MNCMSCGYFIGIGSVHVCGVLADYKYHDEVIAQHRVFKDDGAKLTMLTPPDPIKAINQVFAFGAKKYGPHAWREHPIEWTRISDALERHFLKWKNGADLDDESGLLELAHIGANVVMLLEYAIAKKGTDNRFRYKKEEK